MNRNDVIRVSIYDNTADTRRTRLITSDTDMTYIIYRRQLQLLGMRMIVLTARQRGIPFTSYSCVKDGWVDPRECPDLIYERLGDEHTRIINIFGDVGEIEVEYAEENEEEYEDSAGREDQEDSRVSEP